ncbi:nucleotide-diphospho-sugar transferase [Talaromyces proteolyticus]|uniref:Nucleotide-diphospho-sugar transferase n=1 Tax=Talaromyces proteolyticus TaxID=1131652 RepID=A0AAD4KV92_9EURO|nr:nucleotide-diphospho-sugar transferase [Talaromyces proteolyticus]KAH8700621.1 nucleotide-diphospho-sugar transferase [Talaromyces proteolyticus]
MTALKAFVFTITTICLIVYQFLGDLFGGALSYVFSHPNWPFLLLFVFRYLRLVLNTVFSYFIYRPAEVNALPSYTPYNVTAILPTVDPHNKDFIECVRTCLANKPRQLIIVVVGKQVAEDTENIVEQFRRNSSIITVLFISETSKRKQIVEAIPHITTEITVLLDDHVFWPSPHFLQGVLAAFEDPKVGGVGTNKRVRRTEKGFTFKAFWNLIGAIYLERRNFEARATNAIDGGVSTISGRTSIHRSEILKEKEFIDGFTNERFFFGMFGPLNADDDKFITRYEVRKGWDIKIQDCEDTLVETTLGTYPKYLSQCLRWVRTQWRSNTASLLTDGTVWRRQPWCVYSIYMSSLVNFALLYDTALIYNFLRTTYYQSGVSILYLLVWIFASKVVKLIPYFTREPKDLIFLPGYFAFAYYHSLIKLYALFTFYVIAWGGRNLALASAK